MKTISEMNKKELRAACKEAGITGYGKLTVGGMRDELRSSKRDEELMAECGHTHCPHCNVHLENGMWTFDEALEEHLNPKSSAFPEMFTHEFLCLGCDGEFGEERELPVKGEGIKIEKDRPERNGIKRPSAGGKCRAVWDACDTFYASSKRVPMPKDMKVIATEKGWNENNTVIEMYQWRKFHGVASRQK
jgi:hypothetical protein